MNKKFIPYGRQYIDKSDIEAVSKTLKSDFLTTGPKVEEFESEICKITNSKYSVSLNSATSALHLSCLSLGLEKGDWVWTSSTTFVASSNCAKYCNANIDFLDIDLKTGLIDIEKLKIKLKNAKKNKRLPKIIIPVHLGGSSVDMVSLSALSKIYGFFIIEDASHALGARYNDKNVGSCFYSDITVFSFHPVKMITTGEGGLATTNKLEIYRKLTLLRSHGITKKESEFIHKSPGLWNYEQQDLGYNYRMNDLQASLGLSQLKKLDFFIQERFNILTRYKENLNKLPIDFQLISEKSLSSLHLAIIYLRGLSEFDHKNIFSELRENLIGVQLHYLPVHLHPYYRKLGFGVGDYPSSEEYAKSAMSIPIYPGLNIEDQDMVIKNLETIISKYLNYKQLKI